MSFFSKKIKQEKIEDNAPIFSLSFIIGIPVFFFLSVAIFSISLHYSFEDIENLYRSSLFFCSFLLGIKIFSNLKSKWLKTFIHEYKHAIAVILTGGSIKKIEVGEGEGKVEYSIQKNKLYRAHFIKLAPYYFPLCSLPLLIYMFFLSSDQIDILIIPFGLLSGLDWSTGYGEFAPYQSDIKKTLGGKYGAAMFIFSITLFWLSFYILFSISHHSIINILAAAFMEIVNYIIELYFNNNLKIN